MCGCLQEIGWEFGSFIYKLIMVRKQNNFNYFKSVRTQGLPNLALKKKKKHFGLYMYTSQMTCQKLRSTGHYKD